MYKRIIVGSLLVLAISGCNNIEPVPTCKNGVLSKDKAHCFVTSEPLFAVVQNVQSINGEKVITISDERGRKYKIVVNQDFKIGEKVNINLFQKPQMVIKKNK